MKPIPTAHLVAITGGQVTLPNAQLLQWCNEGKKLTPDNPDLGCAANVAQQTGTLVSQYNFEQFKAALDRGFSGAK